ncbi:tail completion protein gp17 [Bacillus velezensis]
MSTLNSSALLKGLASGGIHNLGANDVSAFPRVVFSEIQDADEDFADNKAYSFEVRYQISIFTQASTRGKETTIAAEIDRLMRGIGFSRYDSQDLYETDTKVFHKARRYKKTYYQEVN